MEIRFRRLLSVTTGLTFVLMLLGIYTAGAGAGLTCGARWPFCDGWLGLFPANWLSFLEWFHRLVAMVAGFVLLGVLYGAWRWQDDRRIKLATTLAILLLPLQIGLGALTVTLSGLFPWGYSPPVQAAHFSVALLIFTAIVLSTAITYGPVSDRRLRQASVAALLVLPAQYLFSFGTVFAYTPTVQIIYYGLSLGLFAILVASVIWSRAASGPLSWVQYFAAGSTVVLSVQMLIGRHLLGRPDQLLADALSMLLFATLAATVWLVFRAGGDGSVTDLLSIDR